MIRATSVSPRSSWSILEFAAPISPSVGAATSRNSLATTLDKEFEEEEFEEREDQLDEREDELEDEELPEIDEEPEKPKRKRARNWTRDESFRLLEETEKMGKNWDKILKKFHDAHVFTDIPDWEQLRKHFNNLNSKSSFLRKPFVEKPFLPKKNKSKRENEILRREFAKKQQLEKTVRGSQMFPKFQ